eukprot:GHVT01012942.1.p1 GENE.GHVT01012942.1~~GHVT01012942.1.p1  ORF type:complete len:316 (+),score=93.84 GHVT01012942.1:435-1382(+)
MNPIVAKASFDLAFLYALGLGTHKDTRMARELLHRSLESDASSPKAPARVGLWTLRLEEILQLDWAEAVLNILRDGRVLTLLLFLFAIFFLLLSRQAVELMAFRQAEAAETLRLAEQREATAMAQVTAGAATSHATSTAFTSASTAASNAEPRLPVSTSPAATAATAPTATAPPAADRTPLPPPAPSTSTGAAKPSPEATPPSSHRKLLPNLRSEEPEKNSIKQGGANHITATTTFNTTTSSCSSSSSSSSSNDVVSSGPSLSEVVEEESKDGTEAVAADVTSSFSSSPLGFPASTCSDSSSSPSPSVSSSSPPF